jgi:hypothetical protein
MFVTVKVILSLCLTKHHANGEMEAFLISTLDGESAPGTRWIGGWVDPRAGLDAVPKIKILCLYRESNGGRPARSLVTVLPGLSRLLRTFVTEHENIRR